MDQKLHAMLLKYYWKYKRSKQYNTKTMNFNFLFLFLNIYFSKEVKGFINDFKL